MLFNAEFLRESTDSDALLEQELLQRFSATIERCTKAIHSADLQVGMWKEYLHEMKGAAATMGAEDLAEVCGNFEQQSPDQEAIVSLKLLADKTILQMRQQLLK